MKLTDIKPGDRLVADGGFTCLDEGEICTVVAATAGDAAAQPNVIFVGELYVLCRSGRHYLDGQENEAGEIVGFVPAKTENTA